MAKRAGNKVADRMLGTVSNSMKKETHKTKTSRWKRAMHNITQREIDLLKKWGKWEEFRQGPRKNS